MVLAGPELPDRLKTNWVQDPGRLRQTTVTLGMVSTNAVQLLRKTDAILVTQLRILLKVPDRKHQAQKVQGMQKNRLRPLFTFAANQCLEARLFPTKRTCFKGLDGEVGELLQAFDNLLEPVCKSAFRFLPADLRVEFIQNHRHQFEPFGFGLVSPIDKTADPRGIFLIAVGCRRASTILDLTQRHDCGTAARCDLLQKRSAIHHHGNKKASSLDRTRELLDEKRFVDNKMNAAYDPQMLLLLQNEFTSLQFLDDLLQVLHACLETPEQPLEPAPEIQHLTDSLCRTGLLKKVGEGRYAPDLNSIRSLLPLTESLKRGDVRPSELRGLKDEATPQQAFSVWWCFLLDKAPERAAQLRKILLKALPERQPALLFLELVSQARTKQARAWKKTHFKASHLQQMVKLGWLVENEDSVALDIEKIASLLPLLKNTSGDPPSSLAIKLFGGYRTAFLEFHGSLCVADPELAAKVERGLEACVNLESAPGGSLAGGNASRENLHPDAYGKALQKWVAGERENRPWMTEAFGEPLYSEEGVGPRRITLRFNKDLFTDAVAKKIQATEEGRMLAARKKIYEAIEEEREPSEKLIKVAKLQRKGLPALKAHRKDGLRVCPALLILHLGKKKIRVSIFAAAYSFDIADSTDRISNQIALEALAAIVEKLASDSRIQCAYGKTLSLSLDVPLENRPLEDAFKLVIQAMIELSRLFEIPSEGQA